MNFSKKLAAATLFAASLASAPAIAAHVPGGIGFSAEPFTFSYDGYSFEASYIDFSYIAEVDQTGFTFDETGMATFSAFRTSLAQPPLGADVTGLNLDYNLYATFSGSGTVFPNPSGGVDGTFTTFEATIWADPNRDTTTNEPTVGPPDESVTPGGNTADDEAILTGTLIVGGFHVFPGLAAGDFAVRFLVTSFDPTVWGGDAFEGPIVTGDINGVNTAVIGVLPPPATFVDAIIIGSGNVSFQSPADLPEPGSLSLLGLGLLGLGALARTRRQRLQRAA